MLICSQVVFVFRLVLFCFINNFNNTCECVIVYKLLSPVTDISELFLFIIILKPLIFDCRESSSNVYKLYVKK